MPTGRLLRSSMVMLGAVCALAGMAGCEADVAAPVRPVAVVGGDRVVNVGQLATLDGSGSHVPGQLQAKLTYQWTLVSAPAQATAHLQGKTASAAQLTPDVSGLYVVSLVVSAGGQASDPAYVNVSTFEHPLPPIAKVGDPQTVDPGTTVTLDGSGSVDPSGSPLTYAWSVTNAPPGAPAITLSDPTAAKPTFVAPGPAGDYFFSLQVTDGHGLTSNLASAKVTVNDVPPVARITGPAQVGEGNVATLSGTTSSDPNGQSITGYSWAMVSTDPVIQLTNATSANARFTAPSICGAAQATVSLVVTAGGKQSPPATFTIDLQDTINDPPTAAGTAPATVDEGSTVTLDGSGSSDCNGDSLTYQWTQKLGPTVTLTGATTAKPTFIAPPVTQDTPFVFQLTVTDPSGASDQVLVDVTENNTIDEPPVAVATGPGTALVQSTVTLDGSGSHDPNPGTTLTYAWVELSGPAVTLTGATTAKPTFTAPSTPASFSFQLTVSDGQKTDVATVPVSVVAGPPSTTQSTIVASKASIPADGSTHDGITVTLKDAAGNLLSGHTVVISTTLGSMIGSVSGTAGGKYTQSLQAGITAGTATVSFTVDGSAPFPNTASVQLDPGPPSGTISLAASPTSLPAGCGASSTVSTAVPIKDQNNNKVADGTEVTVSTDLGTIPAAQDQDAGRPGIQVRTTGGNISFTLTAAGSAGTAHVTATSVTGTATGTTTVNMATPEPAAPVTLTASPSSLTADGSSQTTVTSGTILDTCGNQVAPNTEITVAASGGTIATSVDTDGGVSGIQVKVDAQGKISFPVTAGTIAGTMTVVADNLPGTQLGTVVVSLNPGPATGTISLTAAPGSVSADGSSTTHVTSGVITDAQGNAIADGTSVTVSASPGCQVTTPQTTTGGQLAFDVGPCTTAGTASVQASVAGASGSTTFTVTPGPPAALAFDVQPANTFVKGRITPAVKVSVRDAHGNLVTTSTASINVALGPGAGGAILSGTVPANASGGVATFSNLTVDTAGTYTLVASSSGLPNTTSSSFTVSSCTVSASLAAIGPVAGSSHVLPWDTVRLSPAGTTSCNRQLSVSYTVSPAPARGGFEPWGSFAGSVNQTGPPTAVHFYSDDPQTYTFTLTITDPTVSQTYTATASVTVEAFAALPYRNTTSAAKSRGLALDPGNGNVLIATQGGGGQMFHHGGDTQQLPCLNKSNGRAPFFDGSHFWLAYDDGPEVDQITAYWEGAAFDHCNLGDTGSPTAATGTSPSKTRDAVVVGSSIYLATDADLFALDPGNDSFTEYEIGSLTPDHDLSAVALDTTSQLWVASHDSSPDGVVRTPVPPAVNGNTVYSYLSGDDKVRSAVGFTGASGADEMLLGTDGNGFILIADVGNPASGVQHTFSSNAPKHVRGGASDPAAADAWFATQGGLIRYKSDVDDFVLIPQNEAGLGSIGGDSHAVVLDEGNGRGRILYYATENGVYSVTAP